MTRKQRRVSIARQLHRKIGAAAAGFILFLVLSGLALNHSNSLGLDRLTVKQALLLKWYGLNGPGSIQSFIAGDMRVSFAGSQLFMEQTPVTTLAEPIGAVGTADFIVAAGKFELLLLDPGGQLIERQAWTAASDAPIDSIGLMPDRSVVLQSGQQWWAADSDFIQWDVLTPGNYQPAWSVPQQAPNDVLKAINNAYQGGGLSFERILLDLHSGRFFGPVGVVVYDAIAILLGFLAISGLLLWSRGNNGKKKGSRKR